MYYSNFRYDNLDGGSPNVLEFKIGSLNNKTVNNTA